MKIDISGETIELYNLLKFADLTSSGGEGKSVIADVVNNRYRSPVTTPHSPASSIATHGGAVVEGSVEVGGYFVGRDFIQTVTQVVHSDEEAEEAKAVIAHYLYALVSDLVVLKLGEIDMAAREATQRQPL